MLLTTLLIFISYGIDGKKALVRNRTSLKILQNLRDSIIPDITDESRIIAENYAEKHFSSRNCTISLEYHILKPNLSSASKTDIRNLSQYISSFEDYVSALKMFAEPSPEMNIFLTKIENVICQVKRFYNLEVGNILKTSPTQSIEEYIKKETTSFLKSLKSNVLGKVCPALKYGECYTRVINFTLIDQFSISLLYFQKWFQALK